MTILEIYEKYKSMPNLQTHMLRVAGVSWEISEHMKMDLAKDNIIQACLLHDMGNIIKFDFAAIPEAVEPQGCAYWENVKKEFVAKYGENEHDAHYAIARELGMPNQVLEIIDAIGFSKSEANYESANYNKKIAAYADLRVAPQGVVTLEERLREGNERYKKFRMAPNDDNEEEFLFLAHHAKLLENQIAARCAIGLEEITEAKVEIKVEKLKDYDMS